MSATLLCASMALTAAQSSGQSVITEDFNKMNPTPATQLTSNAYQLFEYNLPDGWYLAGAVVSQSAYMGWLDTNNPRCISFKTTTSNRSYLVTYAQSGTVEIEIQATHQTYVDDPRAFFGLYRMTLNADGTFSVGDAIQTFDRLNKANPDVSYTDWVPVKFDIAEAGYIGFCANYCNVDNYVNTFTVSGWHNVSGVVTNKSGEAVAGATVEVGGLEPVATADNGSFTVENVPEMATTLKVSAPGYQTYTSPEFIPSADTAPFNIVLDETTSTLIIKFMDTSSAIGSSKTWSNGVVSLLAGDTPVDGCSNVKANADGLYELAVAGNLNAEGYTLTGNFPYYDQFSVSVPVGGSSGLRLVEGNTVSSNFVFNDNNVKGKMVTLTVNIRDALTNAPLAGATVGTSFRNHQNQPLTMTFDNAAGAYVSNEIYAPFAADNSYVVTVSTANYVPMEQNVTFNGESKTLSFAMTKYPSTTITGKITRADNGATVGGATVALYDGDTMIDGASAKTNFIGVYTIEFEGDVPAAATLKVEADYFESATVEISNLELGGTATKDVAIAPVIYTFSATVVDDQSQTIDNATVTLDGDPLDRDNEGCFAREFWAGEFANGNRPEMVVVASAPGYEDETYYLTYLDGIADKTYVFVLKKDPNGINDILNDASADDITTIFTLDGKAIDADAIENLAPGVYIVKGRKVLTR